MNEDSATGSQPRNSVWSLVTLFGLLSIVPLILLGYASVNLGERAVDRELERRVRATAMVSAALVEEQLRSLRGLVESFSRRPSLISSLDGPAGAHDPAQLGLHMDQLQRSRPGVEAAFVSDPGGRLLQVAPATPAIIGRDFSHHDWYSGAIRSRDFYVSEPFSAPVEGSPMVVAVATPVWAVGADRSTPPLAVLGAAYGLDALQTLADDLASAQGVRIAIADGGDARLVTSSGGGSVSSPLSARASVRDTGWSVTVEVPASEALAPVRALRKAVVSISLILGAVLLAGMAFVARALRAQRRVEQHLRESEEMARSVIHAAHDAFVSFDEDGRIIEWNDRAEVLFGWSPGEVAGRKASETIIPVERRAEHEHGMARFLETGKGDVLNLDRRVEVEALHRDGSTIPVELALWAVLIQGRYRFNSFVADISDRRRHEKELAAARDQALEASRLKSEFLANMSHEIRTPMNGVIGMTSLLLDTALDDEQREYAEIVRRSADALLDVINDILDFSKIEAGKLELEEVDFDLRALMEDVAELLAPRAHAKGLELATVVNPEAQRWVCGDPGRLRQVLINLMANAVKFTDHGEVIVRAAALEGDDERVVVRFEVTDTGIGVAPEQQERLFAAFVQADASTTRTYGGTGLGLAISRQLVELMGGDIGLVSEPGEGSTFWFTVPLEKRSTPKRDVAAHPPAHVRVLVVDDNATNRAVLEQFLTAWGMRSTTTDRPTAALALLGAAVASGDPFDLAILDFNMAEMDGIALARAVSTDPLLSGTRVVLLTSSGGRGDSAQRREAGIAASLTKPVRQSQLYETIASVMGGARRERAEPSGPRQTAPAPRGTVLVAEDNAVNQRVVSGLLAKLGFEVQMVANGREAVAAATSGSFAAVLMDCQMPEMDGYAATQEIRRREGSARHTPVIAITASALDTDRERCLSAGMDAYVSKPVNPGTLAEVLAKWAGNDAALPEVSPPSPGPQHADALDAGVLAQYDRMSPGFADEVIALFVDDVPVRLEALRGALASGDLRAAAELAHTLKGTSSNVGATRLAARCAGLQSSAEGGSSAEAAASAEAVESAWEQVREMLAGRVEATGVGVNDWPSAGRVEAVPDAAYRA
ncbi:MAG: response regulator [Actinomycetota bacterium]|nr:response regulator [Actinomycetota bacterium]